MFAGWIVRVTATETYLGKDDPLIWHFAMLDQDKQRAMKTMRASYPNAARVEVVAPLYA